MEEENKELSAEKFSDSFKRELDALSNESILNPAYRRKKLILWSIRTSISVVLYVIFWNYTWVKWTLFLTVPLSLFNLLSIFGWNYFLNRKIERTKRKLEEIDKLIEESDRELH